MQFEKWHGRPAREITRMMRCHNQLHQRQPALRSGNYRENRANKENNR
jgi:hypothetical protein